MIKKVYACLFFLGFLFFTGIASAQTTDKPFQVQVQGLQTSNGNITGSLQVTNPNLISYSDVYYVIKLQGEDVAGFTEKRGRQVPATFPGPLINYQTSDTFSFDAASSKSFNFSLPYGSSLTSGKYELQIVVTTNNEKMLGSSLVPVDLQGSGSFLELSNCVIVTGEVEYDPITGPNVAPQGEVYGKCSARNPGSEGITAYPEAVYAVDSVTDAGSEIQTFSSGEAINIPPGATVNIILPLPALDNPQVYEALSYLKDSSGNPVSPRKAFRWVISGESSLIRSINADKSSYKKGETAKVTVGASPSMDLFWRGSVPVGNFDNITPNSPTFVRSNLQGTPLENPTLSVTVKNGRGQTCGSKDQPITADASVNIWPDQIVDVPMDRDCDNPVINAVVKNNGTELASKEVRVPVMVASEHIENRSRNNLYLYIVLGLIILAAAGGGGYYYWKKKKLPPPLKPPMPQAVTVLALIILPVLGLAFQKPLSLLVESTYAQSSSPSPTPAPSPSPSGDVSPSPEASASPVTSPAPSSSAVASMSPAPSATTSPSSAPGRPVREIPPGGNVSIHYEGIKAYRPGQPCPGPEGFFAGNAQPQFSDGAGGCVLDVLSGHDETNFVFQDTQDQITYSDGVFNVPISGEFKGYGCGNTQIGLIVRAYVNGTNQGVKINGQDWRVIFPNVAQNGGGSGTQMVKNLTITPGSGDFCGPQNLKIELTPFIEHLDVTASDFTEDDQLTDADVPGWQNLTYINRQNCGAADSSCFGVMQKSFGASTTGECAPACGVACERDDQCAGAKEGCTACVGGTCKVPPACNVACQRDGDCAGAKDGCTACVGGSCKTPPACNVACQRDGDCAGAKDGCTVCTGGVCKPPAACGTACTTRADCAGATKDGCTECFEGTCTDYNQNMCKCDGIVADIAYPTNQPFKFEAFGKVEGSDVKKAEIADITFRLTKDNQVVAKSDPITPQIVENTDSKLRFKATWQTPPPPADQNSTYRVFADVRCKPIKIVASGSELASAPQAQLEFDGIAQAETLPAPKGLVWISQAITKLFGEGAISPFVKEAMAQLSTPTPLPQAESNLQLRTLNFIKMMDTDNCRFVMWKFDETLF